MRNQNLSKLVTLYKVKVGQRVNLVLDDGDEIETIRADVKTNNPLIYFEVAEPNNPFLVPENMRKGEGKLFAVVDTSNSNIFYRRQDGNKVIGDAECGKFFGYF